LETKCVSFGISQEIYLKAISNFKEQLKNDALSYLKHDDILAHLQVSNPVDKLVLPAFLKYIRINYPDSVKKLQMLSSKLNLENPSNLFPDARQMKREIIMHVGPTNS
jgi:ATP-dependent RNA helicase SUPV3L1/SUV3